MLAAFLSPITCKPIATTHEHTAEVFKTSSLPGNKMAGRMGVGLLPGSEWVWDRAAQQLVKCNPERCPNAHTMQRASGTTYVNRMLYSGGRGHSITLNAYSPLSVLQVRPPSQ
jgi:hypothetical protein